MRKRVYATLLLVLLGFFFLEALLWARQGTTVLQYAIFPRSGHEADGNVLYWTRTYRHKPESHHIVRYYDENRRVIETRKVPINEQGDRETVVSSDLELAQRPTVWDQMDHPKILEDRRRRFRGWSYHLLQTLNNLEAHRREIRFNTPIQWVARDGRIVAVDVKTRETLADPGLAYEGKPDFTALDWFRYNERLQRYRGIFDSGDGTLSFLSLAALKGEIDEKSRDPLKIQVEPLGLRGRVVNTSNDGALIAQGQMLVLLRGDGTISTGSEWGEGEDLLVSQSRSAANGLETTLGAVSPTGARIRLRIVRPGDETIVRDIDMHPVTASEKTIAFLSGLVAVARPLPLNLVAAFSDPPRTFDDLYQWWWRDPYFAGGAFGWLAVSMLVAAACGWRSRRSATIRCPAQTGFWTVAGVVLGPLGLLWMRLVVGKAPVEEGRAVDVESDDWPEPILNGTEVFA